MFKHIFGNDKDNVLKENPPVQKCKKLVKAEEISKKYGQLSNCCKVISAVQFEKDHLLDPLHIGGWRLFQHTITESGIDIEDVYSYINRLAVKRKETIESELSKLDL